MITCLINPIWEKSKIQNHKDGKEYWIEFGEIPSFINKLSKENNIEGVWLEGPFGDCSEIIWKYNNTFPNNHLSFTIN